MPTEDLASDTSTESTDYSASVDRIGSMLGSDILGKSEPHESVQSEEPAPASTTPANGTPAPQTYEVPKSWKKEMHEHWGKVSPETQAYIIEREKQLLDGFSTYRPVQDAISPYLDWLQRSNIRPEQAVRSLFEAQMRLTQGPIEARRAAMEQLQKSLGLMPEPSPEQPTDQNGMALKSIQDKMNALEQHFQSQNEAQMRKIQAENEKMVNDFAADTKAHPYFEEVADEMAIFIKQGDSLQEAYAKAVRVNAAVSAKEQARLLTEAEAKWKENARLSALPKKKAASVNIQSDQDGAEPTEPLGSIEDTIKRTHKLIRARG